MPAVPGSTYYVSSYVSSFNTTAAYKIGTDLGGGTTTVITIDNESPAAPTGATALKSTTEQFIISYTSSATTDAQDILITRSPSNTTDQLVEGINYAAGSTIGASTVICVASSSPVASAKTCIDSTLVRSVNYFYKLFSKDANGNYSSAISISGAPHFISAPNSGRGAAGGFTFERETQNGATTTVTGSSGSGGGFGDTGTTTTATTTVSTSTPSKGGGGGDSGFIYKGSTIASLLRKTAESLINQSFTRTSATAFAETDSSSNFDLSKSDCEFTVLGICLQPTITDSR